MTLTVGFATPAQATGVIVRETNGNGFVTEVELQDTGGTYHTIWTGTDPSPADNATDFILTFPQTAYTVQAVRVSVDTGHDAGDWEEIDAVRLLTGGSPTGLTTGTQSQDAAPTAGDVWAEANVGQAVTVPVLANSTDPDGNALTVSAYAQGANGTVTLASDAKSVTYTPGSGFSGSDSFTFTVSDGLGKTATATAHVTVADGQWASTVTGSSSQANDGTYGTTAWALGAADTTTYGDTSASWSPDPNSTATGATLTLGVASPDYATGVLIRESSGNGFVTQVEVEDTGDNFYTVWTGTDGTAAGAVQDFVTTFTETSYPVKAVRVTVNPATADGDPAGIDAVKLLTAGAPPSLPAAPAAAADSATTAENMPVNIPMLANDTNSAGGYLYVRITSGPSDGTAAVTVDENAAGSGGDYLTYWPGADFSGTDSFTYTLTDASGQSSSATVSVTVTAVNQPPVAGTAAGYTVAGSAVTLPVLTNASDPDGDTVTVSSVTAGQHGTTTLNTGGTVTYTPTTGFTGQDEFTYTVGDGHGHTDTGTATVLVYEAGSWANSLRAVSSGRDSADSVLGMPDDAAWTPDGTTTFDFITVGFASASYATGVLVRDEGGGAVTEVDLIDTGGTGHVIWSGTDPASSSSGGPVDFVLSFPTTGYQVAAVTVVLDNSSGAGGVDAVRLLTGGTASALTVSGRGFDGGGDYVATTYNTAGQPVTTQTYSGGGLVQTVSDQYDGVSGSLTISDTTDANGDTTRETFDAAGKVLAQTLDYGITGAAATTTYVYDGNEHLTQVTDPDGNVTSYVYDAAGNQTSMTDPRDHTATQTFDDQNRVATMTNRNGMEIDYVYDSDGRETGETWKNAGGTVVNSEAFTYDDAGREATASNTAGGTTYEYDYTYDPMGRLIKVEEPFGVALSFTYDRNGNRNGVTDSLGGSEASLYNSDNQLVRRTLTQGGTTQELDFTYTGAGQVATIERYSSEGTGRHLVATTDYSYGLQGNVTGIETREALGTVIDEFDYVYDLAGDLTSETDNGTETGYGYDGQGQLTSAGSASYAYDRNGNPTNTGDTTVTGNELSTDGLWDYSYDAEGNLIAKAGVSGGIYAAVGWTYTYDNKNELTKAVQETGDPIEGGGEGESVTLEVDYRYDVFGNRIEMDVTQASSTTVTRFAYDDWNPAKSSSPVGNENNDVWADVDGAGTLQERYLRGDAVDQLFAAVGSGGVALWDSTDHLGSVRTVYDSSGAVQDRISYDAFGNITSETHPENGGRYKYTGREFDAETQLQYNRGRYYDATTGRWISQDPLGFEAGDSNLYRYVQGSPTTAADPSGLQRQPAFEAREIPGRVRLADRFPVWVDFTWTPNWQKEVVIDALRQAAIRIDKAHYAINNLWPQVAKRGVFQPMPFPGEPNPAPVELPTYKFLKKNYELYKGRIQEVYDVLKSNDGEIPIWSSSWQGTRNKAGGLNETKAWVAFYNVGVGSIRGSYIDLTPWFFNVMVPVDGGKSAKTGAPRSLDDQTKVLVHEFGRFYLRLQEENTGSIEDVYKWDSIIGLLVDTYDAEMKSYPP